jgi:hypothetical protein
MPKLDGTHIVERLQKRIAEMEAGVEVAAKDIRALLTDSQQQSLDDAWTEQELLRNGKRARNDEEKLQLGWKTKKDVRLEAFKAALKEAEDAEVDAWAAKLHNAEVRQAKIYLEESSAALKADKSLQEAQNIGNNSLTRAGLARIDGQTVGGWRVRDREVNAIEDALRERFARDEDAENLAQDEQSAQQAKVKGLI